jgi:hypothetical protein
LKASFNKYKMDSSSADDNDKYLELNS